MSRSRTLLRPIQYLLVISLMKTCLSSVGGAQATHPPALFQHAVEAQQRGDDAIAIKDYRELLQAHPEAVAVRVNLGATLAHSKRYGEAIAQYRLVLTREPRNKLARMNLALAYQSSGDLPAAIKSLELLRQSDPADSQSIMVLADCYVQSGRGQDAIALLTPLEAAHANDPEVEWLLGSALITTGHAQQGVVRVEKAATIAANGEAWLLAGRTRLEMSQFDLARKDAEAAKALDPHLAGLATLVGMIDEQTADYDGAEVSLLLAVAENDKDYDAHYALGANYYFKRDMANARVQLTRALELQPTSAQARFEMALVERADGQMDAALKDLERVVRQAPDWLQPHIELSGIYFRLHRPEDGAKQKEIVDRLMARQQQSETQPGR